MDNFLSAQTTAKNAWISYHVGKRAVYKDVDKIRIAKYACENGKSKAVSKFTSDFP